MKNYLRLLTIMLFTYSSVFGQIFSTKGTDFWFGFMENYVSPTPTVYISSDVATSGTISIPGQTFSQPFTVAANSTTAIPVPLAQAHITTNQTVESKAVHVVSNDPVTVYALNYEAYSSDASIVLPTNTLGIEYYTANVNPTVSTGTYPSEILIVGIQNGSTIEITPSVATNAGNAAGVPFNITLNQGETYQVQASGDLTGTYIQSLGSCEKFAVFAGAQCTNVGGCPYCDHLSEQMYPISTWGLNYAISPLQTRSADIYRIIAANAGTNVTVNGGAPFTLGAGQFNQQTLTPASFITADQPIMVVQYSRGGDCDGANADPFTIVLSPVEQTLDNITFNAFNSNVISSYFVNIISKTSTKNQVSLDGSPIGGFFNAIPSNPTYSYAQMSITQGNHTIDADSGAIATVYGYGSYESYGYVAGASLNNLGVSYNADAQGQNYGFASIPQAQICANSQVDFHGETGPYTVLSWAWDFGDGNSSTGQNPSHTYTADGTYIVTLTSVISNLCLNDTVVVQQTVNIQNVPPPTTVTPSPLYMCPGDAVQLNVMSSNGGATHLWSDGAIGTSTSVSPPVDSTYTVTTSWYGCTQIDSVFVDVRDPGTVPACNVIYVTPTGTGTGTQASPTDLLTALSMSNCNGALIRMAIGTYNFNNPISTISSFTTIEGGFDDGNGWQKTSAPGATTINRTSANLEGPANAERMVAIYGNGIHDFRLQDLTITTDPGTTSASGYGVSTYGMHLTAAYNYEIVRCQIQAGAAGDGLAGTNGANGTTGAIGGNGTNGSDDNQSSGGGGGNGGNGGGATNAGAGGNCCSTSAFNGGVGGAPAGINGGGGGGGASGGGEDRDGGTGGTGGSGNAGGSPGQESGCNGSINCGSSESGGAASNAVVGNGTNGTAGAAGANGTITAGFWIPGTQGTSGTNGTGGEGGGGGGGGAGEGGTFCIDGHGSGGGGGGGGGQGGTGGTGGFGGGSAYAVYLFNNGINGNFINSNVSAGAAGNGGAIGTGGNGGLGGNGGNGSTYSDEVGCGGDGADGGDGGDGGNGGIGQDGQSTDIVLDGGTALATSDDAFNLVGQAVISVDNVTCTMTSTDFSGPSSSAWNAGAGATPATATSNTLTTQYSSTGFKDIDFGADTYTGFVNIVVSGSGLAPVIGSTATLYGTDYHVCVGDAADFIAVSSGINYNYFWDFDNAVAPSTVSTTNDTVPGLVFNTPGTYNVTLQIQTPCCGLSATTANVTLIVDPIPTPTIAANPGAQVCYGDSVELTASGGNSYLWTTGETTPSIFVTPGDTMTVGVIATAFECSATSSILVDPIISSVYISGIDQICSGDVTTLTANGMPGSTYTWTGPVSATTASITDGQLTDEWYYVEADLMGCLAYDSMQVLVTGVSAEVNSTDTTVCIGDSVLLTVEGGSYYNWSTGSTNDSIYVSPVSDSTFQVIVVWDSVGTIACSTSDTAWIDVQTFTVPNINNVSADTLSCTGDTLTFTASGGTTYLWSTGETTQTISPVIQSDTSYTVNSVSADGCLSLTDTIFVTTLPGIDSINLNITDASCYGFDDGAITSTVNGGVGPFDYLWSNGETTTSIDTLLAGSYSLEVTASNGCVYTQVGSVLQPDSVIAEFTATPDSGLYPLEVTFTNMSYNGATYEWDFNNGITSTNLDEVVMFDTGAVYNVMLIAYDALGCSDTAYYNINVVGEAVVVIPNIFTPNGDGSNDLFRITAKFIDTYEVNIFNRWGNKVAEYDWVESSWDGRTLSGIEAAEGVYYYIITAKGYDGQEFEFNGHFRLIR